ncbi:Dolichyl-phosphate-mannose-protein mannosyltransferase, putative [Trichomonas vaginalis G3]|uniref:Dolichyl-phosphate-mannose-protein mannosyltransferase, putative n=1 Tax=Trichomonas vaginalis (strain ATCC PRA-98 / G3) TaxID=412133 RepID=A2FU43_TRIV3|nr:Dolichyl-phosphate-mannose-protein mannosyltransferase, putative [Trichomonas vaginalis G3]|eukprot:XP_001304495.1 Dolichyl-phosphate-mannose-protein mannosyltransferase [Trichomonas vaginalis G3]
MKKSSATASDSSTKEDSFSSETKEKSLSSSENVKSSPSKSKGEIKDTQNNDDSGDDIVIAFDWNGYDTLCLFVLLFIGIVTRFYLIQYPKSFVDREAMHIGYINSYLNGSFFVDSQPPLAELLLAFYAGKSGYRQSIKPHNMNANYTYQSLEYVSLRTPSTLFSTFVVPLSFINVRLLGGSTFASMSAGIFTVFDFLLVSTSRSITTDGFVQFFVALTVFFSALLRHYNPSSTSWSICIICQSLFAGCAVASNWNGISLVLFVVLFNYLTYHTFRPIPVNLSIIFIIFYFAYITHVIFLPYQSINMKSVSGSYRKDLIKTGQPLRIKHLKVCIHAIELIFISFKHHVSQSHIVPVHRWIFMTCKWKVLFRERGRIVAVFGNLPVWFSIGLATISEYTKIFLSRRLREPTAIVFFGYLSGIIFLLLGNSERGLCDYGVPLMFGIWGLSLCFDSEFPPDTAGFILSSLCVASMFIYMLWSPFVYGYDSFGSRFLPYFAE